MYKSSIVAGSLGRKCVGKLRVSPGVALALPGAGAIQGQGPGPAYVLALARACLALAQGIWPGPGPHNTRRNTQEDHVDR